MPQALRRPTLAEAAPTAPFGFGSIEPRRDAQGNTTLGEAAPNSWRGCALSVAMPQALRRSG
ncbi:hypothetical protein [Nostoc sp.]|uniref:hypothetical protein n=1 Tax=Nostoc sp. TaxID=1180 RepID=UPI002FF78D43